MDFTFILHSLANGRPLVSHAACDDLKMSITYTFNSAMEPIVGSCMAIIKTALRMAIKFTTSTYTYWTKG